ncbi:MAG: SDR family NAD(P)-dependent oxidoreductase [Desulfobacterales bacterium]|nr:SDR family NAD(P)-dependent oxidoreductase [Desulfobacterales bacterium]
MNIAQHVERHGRRCPQKPAVIFEGNIITYGELEEYSNKTAGILTDLGIRRGDRVALCLLNHPSFISSYLGIQKLGAVAVSVNTSLKPTEVAFILEDAQIRVLLTTTALNPSNFILPVGCHLLLAENIGKLNLSKQHSFLAVERDAEDLAAILYTSGTTGFPKGAMLTQGNLLSNIQICVKTFGYTEDDRILLFLPLFHNFGQYAAMNPCLEAGATLILHREFEQKAIVRSIAEHQVTTFFGVPSIYSLLLDQAAASEMSSVKRYISAAAALPSDIARRWEQKIGVPVSQGYGLTECSLICFNPSPLRKPDSAGIPLEGIEVKIVDDLGREVGSGELGEIIVRGTNVMSGYWHRPEETAQVLKEDWFHTGDIGQVDADGYLYIADRLKDMINVGGDKVYPSEVENRFYQHPAVAEVAVYGVAEPILGEQVHAELVLKATENVTAEELTEFCRPMLADYKLPSVIKFVESLPKSKTGKILKRMLREQAQTKFETVFDAASPVRFSDEIKIWLQNWLNQKLIRDGRAISPEKPFADYGLTSRLAVMMVRQLSQWMGKSLSPVIVWNYPTINTLAAHLGKGQFVESSGNSLKKHSFSGEPEPVAVIGMGCRFPGGANTPAKFWELLRNGTDTAADIPSSRWDIDRYYDANRNKPGKMYVRTGSFLEDTDKFDARFFGIPSLEAESIDPQQRFLLEVGWEAIENAGIAQAELQQTKTGVFIGSFWDDYSGAHLYQEATETLDAYRMLSSLRGLTAGRLAYILDIQGPVMQLDTACSSSLLAVHLACQSLGLRECHLALAGGVSIFLSPVNMIGLCALRAISSDGRSKSFAAQSDGFGVGEGAGIVILKRLSDAIAEGDRILAVIKGSAVNHDGHTNGLTAPNGLAQAAVLRQALQNARVSPDQIDYIEAHGTGTELGDLIELNALGQVFAPDRSRPLMIGSVKSNIGHLSAAAGIASLIKVVLSLQHGFIPPSLHFDEPNSHISWAEQPFTVPTALTPWTNKTKLAGISSFGMTGTNVHVIIAEAPASESIGLSVPERPIHLCTLSGKTGKALSDQVVNFLNHLTTHSELRLSDLCYTANTGRVHFKHRLAVAAKTTADFQQKLRAFQHGKEVKGLLQGRSAYAPPPIAFLFTGQGSQYADMGRELYETQPVFQAVMDQCQEILQTCLETPLLEVLYGEDKETNERRLIETQYTQPALFAIEYALAKLWQSWGVVPNFVMGHSVGEYAAACAAGVFSMEDGLKLVAERARLMQQLQPAGMMVAVQLDEARLTKLIQPYRNEITIATFNAPQNLVLSGQTGSMETLVRQLTAQGIRCRRLSVSHAFHSSLITPMIAEFERVLQLLTYKPPQLKLVSNLTGGLITEMGADYWVKQICQPVRFEHGMKTLAESGAEVFIEVGPRPVLLGLGQQCLAEWSPEKSNLATDRADKLWLPSLYPKQQSDWQQLSESLASLYVHGIPVNWRGFDSPYNKRQKVDLPTYPFQRQRYWTERKSPAFKQSGAEHPLKGQKIVLAHSPEILFQTSLSADSPAYLTDHRVYDKPILPASAYLEMVLSAGQELFQGKSFLIRNVAFQRPLFLSEGATTVQLVCIPIPNGYRWQVFSLAEASKEWRLHSAGNMEAVEPPPLFLEQDLVSLQARCPSELSVQAHYQHISEQGLDYGPAFRGVEQLFQGAGKALGRIRLPESLSSEAGNYLLHPALLDACFHMSGAVMDLKSDEPLLPFWIDMFRLYDAGGHHQTAWSYSKIREEETGRRATATSVSTLDLTLLSDKGQVIAEVSGLTLSPANLQTLSENTLRTDWIYQLRWQPASLPAKSPYADNPGRWLIIADPKNHLALSLAERLRVRGERVDMADAGQVHPLTAGYRSVIYLGALTFSDDSASRLGADPCLSPEYFPSPDAIRTRLLPDLMKTLGRIGFYNKFRPGEESLSAAYAWRAFRQLGWTFSLFQNFSEDRLAEDLGVISRHRRLFRRLLEIFGEDGFLKPSEDRFWQVMALPDWPDPEATLSALLAQYPMAQTELNLLGRCGNRLADVLRGECEPLELIFPNGDLTSAIQLYKESPSAQVMNHLVRIAVGSALENLPQDRRVRILEIGGGTGSTTAYLLPHLPALQTQYVFTDISSFFTAQAQEQFENYPFVRCQQLDLERAPQAQGFDSHPFDIVIASNVVHATQDLHQTLQHLHNLLVPGGLLIMVETVAQQRWLDLTFGLLDGWWRFSDTQLRPAYPLLSDPQWQTVLQESGYPQTALLSPDSACGTAVMQSLIIAQTPSHQSLPSADRSEMNISRSDVPFPPTPCTVKSVPQKALELATQALRWIQEIIAGPVPSRLWLVTLEAMGEGTTSIIPIEQSVLWGLGRTMMWEHPEVRCTCLDMSADTASDTLFETLWYADSENQLVLRQGQRLAARLVRYKTKPARSLPLREENSYLIVGGMGGLGMKVAEWLVNQGVRNLVLSGRRGADSEASQTAIRHLETMGANVSVVKADISQAADVARLLTVSNQLAPLRGIIHAAGRLEDAVLIRQSSELFNNVFAPKVAGIWHLHTLSQEMEIPLDFFVCFSSVASLLGHGGQSNHAAANAFQDALVFERRRLGLPGLSINWSGWSEVGAAAAIIRETGETAITPAQGVALFGELLKQDAPQLGVLPYRWAIFEKQLPAGASFPILATLMTSAIQTKVKTAWLQQLAYADPEERHARLKQQILFEIQTVAGITPTDTQNFFSLGMDSLQSIQLGSRLASSFGVSLPATLAMKYPTLAKLKNYLAETLFEQSSQQPTILHADKFSRSVPDEAKQPQLDNQQECYLRHEQTANKACNHICMPIRIVSPVDKTALKSALQTLTDRHDVLRTVYFRHGADFMQQVIASQTVDFEMTDVDCQSWEESASLIQEAARKPFDLKHGPVLRCCLFSRKITDHLFLMVIHHIAADATAFAILLKEFWILYQAYQCKPEIVLPPVKFSFSDYVRWQTAMLQGEEGERLWRYWQKQLAGHLPCLNLPTDYNRPPEASNDGACYLFELDEPLTQQLRKLAQDEEGTLYMILLTAFKLLLRQYSGQDDIWVAAHTLNRTKPEFSNTVGYLADTVILRTRIPEQTAFRKVFRQVRGTVLGAIEHQGYPMKLLAERLQLPLNSLYSVWFTMLPQQLFHDAGVLLFNHGEITSTEPGGLNLKSANNIIPPWLGVWYELELNLIEGKDAVSGILAYCSDLFKESTIAGMVADFKSLLKKIASDSEKKIEEESGI